MHVSLRFETFVVGPFPNNLYLLRDEISREFVVIDPSIQSEAALSRAHQLQSDGYALKAIWNTHGHLDHVYDNARWKEEFQVPIWMHQDDVFLLDHLREQAIWIGLPAGNPMMPEHFLHAGQTLTIGRHEAGVLWLPGHSPGSVAFHFAQQNLIFSGDVLFRNSIGRTDLPGCDENVLKESLRTLAALPDSTRVLTGHGASTSIAAERAVNPFLSFLG